MAKLLHISIPKNAGTYIADSLAINFAPEDCYIVDEDTVNLSDFLADAERITSTFSFVAGHIPFKLVEPHAGKFDLIISSYRQPWRNCWSAFRFITTQQPKWSYLRPRSNADAGAKFHRFIDAYFIANGATRNFQCSYLGHANLPDSAMRSIEKHHIKMLSCANLDADLLRLGHRANLKINPQADRNETLDQSIAMRPGDDPALDRKIFDWFDGDYALNDLLLNHRAG